MFTKLLGKLVSEQLISFLNDCDNFPLLQSAYSKEWSYETGLLYYCESLAPRSDGKQRVLLLALNMSAAFDTVNHSMLL